MKRILKGFGLLFLLATVTATLLSVGCAPPEDPDQPQSPTPTQKILFLGDSIAEAILGASPLSERESYGYYGVVGIVNNFWYVNRSISGHQTKQLLDYIRQGDDGAMLTDTHIRTADIIHISILGNDLLQNNLGEIMYNELIGETEKTDLILAKAAENFAAIVTVLREKNPDAVLIFQSVYNPIHPDSVLVNARVRKLLADRGIAPDQYRTQCQPTLDKLNDISKTELSALTAEEMLAFLRAWAFAYGSDRQQAYFTDEAYLLKVLSLCMGIGGKKRRKDFVTAKQALSMIGYFFGERVQEDAYRVDNATRDAVLQAFLQTYDASDDAQVWFSKVKEVAASLGFAAEMRDYKADPAAYKGSVSDVAEVLRIAVTGRANTPDLWSIMQIMGEEKARARIQSCIGA